MPKSIELERRESKKGRNNKGTVCRIQKKGYNCEKDIRVEKKKDLMSRIQSKKKKRVVELRGSSILHRGKSIAKRCMDRGSERHSKKGGQIEKLEEDI